MKRFNPLPLFSVAIVLITLGASFGVLSGRGAIMGMISTSVICLITALIGGSRYGVSSPTGPMTAIVAVILLSEQNWLIDHPSSLSAVEIMNLTVVLAAVMVFMLLVLKVHKLVKWVPNLVVSGFVNGIALIIVLKQLQSVASGVDGLVMMATFVLAILATKINSNRNHIVWQLLEGSLVVIVLMSLVSWYFELPVSYLDLQTSIADFSLALPKLQLMDWELAKIVVPLAFELALIALLDTLLTAVIMDKKTGTKTVLNRELSGQSLSLFAVSLFGGIPGAQSTVPSMMLYQEGGHHKYSKLMLAVFCLIITFLLADLIQFVPKPVFGGIILKIAWDVADLMAFRTIVTSRPKYYLAQLLMVSGTVLVTVFVSLNAAVISFTLAFVLWNKYMPKQRQVPDLMQEQAEGLTDEV